MLKSFSELISKLTRGAPSKPRPSGDELAALLFTMKDPIDLLLLTGLRSFMESRGMVLSPRTTAQQALRAYHEELLGSTELCFVARPESMKALRDSGHVHKDPNGVEVARLGAKRILFFGYAEASMDDYHWGLELRRVGPQDVANKELHALRESAAEAIDEGADPPRQRARSAHSGRI